MLVASLSMLVLGAGVGLTMQVLVLAAQNSVPREDLGVVGPGATFFRSKGGALGLAVLGAQLTDRSASTIPAALVERGGRPARRAHPARGPAARHRAAPGCAASRG